MKKVFTIVWLTFPLLLSAGTGHAKDMDLAYFLFLLIVGFILLIWNGFDFLAKNKHKISGIIGHILKSIKYRIRHKENRGHSNMYLT